jgi:hypothetical protein
MISSGWKIDFRLSGSGVIGELKDAVDEKVFLET